MKAYSPRSHGFNVQSSPSSIHPFCFFHPNSEGIHFYSDEGNEPPHIHVATPDGECKFWLQPVRLARNKGVPPLSIRKIEKIVFENQLLLMGKYNEFQDK